MSETPQSPPGGTPALTQAAEGEMSAAEGTTAPFWMTGSPAASEASGQGDTSHRDLAEDAGLAAERERLIRQLRDTRVQLAMTQTRLTALEQSATMRFGRTIANAAKKPWPRGALLPRDLYKLWRDRGAPKSGAQNAANALAQAQLADLKGNGGRFLSQLTAPGAASLADPALALAGIGKAGACGLVITGAISGLGCATLAPDAVVHPLLPHDADIVVEATGADIVMVQASALLPGEPWAYATDPAAADRGRRLARMIVMARALGKPVVLVRDVPHSLMPGIGWLAASCDAVLDGGLGVQLARFNPLGVSPARSSEPRYAGARDLREAPAVRALLDSLTSSVAGAGASSLAGDTAAVRLAGARSWRSLPALYRDNAVFVTASAAQRLEQAASGARVIGPLGSGTNAATVRGELAAARAERPLTLPELRVVLRDIFLASATPARLGELVRAAELPGSLVGGRQVGVLVSLADGAQAARLATALLAQRLRPAEVVASAAAGTADAVRAALGMLGTHQIRVTVTDDAGGTVSHVSHVSQGAGGAGVSARAGADWARPLARLATVPWLAPWAADAGQTADYLLDLACARECAQADAVGLDYGKHGACVEYEFTRWLEAPALVRAQLLGPGGPPEGDWGSHGLRLFSITAQRAS